MAMMFNGFGLRQQQPWEAGGAALPRAMPPMLPPPESDGPAGVSQAAPAMPSGVFGNIGTGRAVAGTIGDALLRLSGSQPVFTPMLAQRQQEARIFAQQQNQQQAELQRQLAIAADKRAHPEPTELERQHDYLLSLDPTGELARNFINTKTTAPPIVQHNDDGTLSVFPAGMVPRSATTPQPAPAGVTFTPIPGGATPAVTAPFPARR